VKAGDVVKVKVLEVDIPRKRIALTMRLSDEVQKTAKVGAGGTAQRHTPAARQAPQRQPEAAGASGAMAAAFAKLKR
jgi:uncharacterized protein